MILILDGLMVPAADKEQQWMETGISISKSESWTKKFNETITKGTAGLRLYPFFMRRLKRLK